MRLCLFSAVLVLSACQLTLPGKAPDVAAVNPVTAGQISVTPLDAPPVPAEPVPAEPELQGAAAAADPTPDVAEAPPAPPPPKSAAQIACEKGKGNWTKAGKTGTMSCQYQLRDSGKQCSRDRDCEGQCLARSRSCAPFAPLFGCHEVLQDNGQRVTLCID